jgi:Family of unknown function (DUF6445)
MEREYHPFIDYVICRNNYFNNPEIVVELSKKVEYSGAEVYPGVRSGNLLASDIPIVKDFAIWFANRLGIDIFPGITNYETAIYFHINNSIDDLEVNHGWIHKDIGNLAGLVYLTEQESNFDSGTSIFNSNVNTIDDLPEYMYAWREFNITRKPTDKIKEGFKLNNLQFTETIRIGNQYNRLIAYDSKLSHRPNSFSTNVENPRLTLLFFISRFNYKKENMHE